MRTSLEHRLARAWLFPGRRGARRRMGAAALRRPAAPARDHRPRERPGSIGAAVCELPANPSGRPLQCTCHPGRPRCSPPRRHGPRPEMSLSRAAPPSRTAQVEPHDQRLLRRHLRRAAAARAQLLGGLGAPSAGDEECRRVVPCAGVPGGRACLAHVTRLLKLLQLLLRSIDGRPHSDFRLPSAAALASSRRVRCLGALRRAAAEAAALSQGGLARTGWRDSGSARLQLPQLQATGSPPSSSRSAFCCSPPRCHPHLPARDAGPAQVVLRCAGLREPPTGRPSGGAPPQRGGHVHRRGPWSCRLPATRTRLAR